MVSKPWFQIAAFVLFANIGQALALTLAAMTGYEILIYAAMMLSCTICTALLVVPSSATTGHKMLVLTYLFATFYFAVATISTAFVMAGSLLSWYLYNQIHNGFIVAMQTLTAIEVLCVFGNAGARMGRVGDIFGRSIDYIYSAIVLRIVGAVRISRI